VRLHVWLLLPEPSPCELGAGQRSSTNTPYFCRRIFRGFSLMLRDYGRHGTRHTSSHSQAVLANMQNSVPRHSPLFYSAR
jgi:hypothetical protein